jgi:hypothetical protein
MPQSRVKTSKCNCYTGRCVGSVAEYFNHFTNGPTIYRGADKSLARPGRKQATATEDFEFRISYL